MSLLNATRRMNATSSNTAKATPALDDLDRRILTELQLDASLSNVALAARVHASTATCLRRVARLRRLGVIERQVALVDPALVGEGVTLILEITLDSQADEVLTAFERAFTSDPAVQQLYRMMAGPDFVAVVWLAQVSDYAEWARRQLSAVLRVRQVRSYTAARRAKFVPAILV